MVAGNARRDALNRWRWRLRGAAMWPTFGLCAAADIALLYLLPLSAGGASLIDAFLLGGALNLAVVAVLAPLAGALLRRRRRDLPRVVATDYAGTMVLLSLAGALLVAGLANHGSVAAARRADVRQSDAVRAYVTAHASSAYRRHLAQANSVRLGADLFRSCVPGAVPDRALCLFVDTSGARPRVRVDSDPAPNWTYFNHRAGDYSSYR